MTRGRTTTLVAGAGLAAALLGAGAAAGPSVGAPDDTAGVWLSVDGESWAQELRTPLLDPDRLWVPGDVRRASLLVRHDGAGPARGTVTTSVRGHPALAESFDVRVRAGLNTWNADGSAPVVVGQDDELPVELEIALEPGAGNDTQGASVRLDVDVVLAGDAVAHESRPGTPLDLLPRTGADAGPVLVLALAAVAAGFAARAAGRHRGADDG
ncbi:hypothetical protein MWU57_00750 [Isoptericola sp. S6320L]|uniref:hypothetical protein n=1 Tax=Isoptericola sp. S6320L TaxID=2926411 RepID=UPI001FF1889F|nr:hypothetical protein [Isoptericola sp. S6320L]MCK0115552.1 hypothetical protein [Isoptericola sp. S6320L]